MGEEPGLQGTGSEGSPPQPPGVGYRGGPLKGCASMPGSYSPAGNQRTDNPILFTGNDRPVRSANSPRCVRVPWWPAGTAAASLVAPAGLGMIQPVTGEVIGGIEVLVVLTIIATALFGSQALSERAFRLLRWFGNRPEPPAPGK